MLVGIIWAFVGGNNIDIGGHIRKTTLYLPGLHHLSPLEMSLGSLECLEGTATTSWKI